MLQYLPALGEDPPQSRIGFIPTALGFTTGLMSSFDDVRKIMRGDKKNLFPTTWFKDIVLRPAKSSVCIFDSGLFSVFDLARKDKTLDIAKMFESYAPAYRDYINYILSIIPEESRSHCYFVNLDTDFLLGLDNTRAFNDFLLKNCPRENLIGTYHGADGKKYLDELIEKFDYIAVADGYCFTDATFSLKYLQAACEYAKNKKPEIKIHVLGKSGPNVFRALANVADTCDSSSWRLRGDKERLACSGFDMADFWSSGLNYGFCGGLEKIKRLSSGIPQSEMHYSEMMIEVLQLYDLLAGANRYSRQVVRDNCPVRNCIDDFFGIPHDWWDASGGPGIRYVKFTGVKMTIGTSGGGRKIMETEFLTQPQEGALDVGQDWSDFAGSRKKDWSRKFGKPENF